ncbi:hypothetical protein ZWY2020_007657 [Hordeum vulgare]|nr:hypothetical protein ZWY2020_007657 [Hordeum vulgare]
MPGTPRVGQTEARRSSRRCPLARPQTAKAHTPRRAAQCPSHSTAAAAAAPPPPPPPSPIGRHLLILTDYPAGLLSAPTPIDAFPDSSRAHHRRGCGIGVRFTRAFRATEPCGAAARSRG